MILFLSLDGSGGSSESINSRSSSATHGSGEQMMTTSVDLSHSLGGSVQRGENNFLKDSIQYGKVDY